jgi:hypothetical protein
MATGGLFSLLGAGAGGAIIGGATMKLFLDPTEYEAALAKVQAQNDATFKAGGAAASKWGTITKTAAIVAGVAMLKFAVDSVHAAIQAQQAQDQLTNSVENSKAVTASSIPVFNQQSQAVSNLTGVFQENVTGAQSMLVQFGLTQDQVTTLTPLVVDLSQKMGIDLNSAAKAVGKSVEGSAGSLNRYGIVVDKTQEKTNAFAATTQALSRVQGAAAEKLRSEPWLALQNDIHNTEVEVGQGLLPSIRELMTSLEPLIRDSLPLVAGWFKVLAQDATGLAYAIDVVSRHARDLEYAVPGLSLVLGNLHLNSGQVSAALGGLFGWLGYLRHPLQADTAAADGLAESLNTGIDSMYGLAGSTQNTTTKLKHFAQLGGTIKQWETTTVSSLKQAETGLYGTATAFKNADKTFQRSFDDMIRQSKQVNAALQKITPELASSPAGRSFLAFLQQQGPAAIVGFAQQSKQTQQQDIQHWQTWQQGVSKTGQKMAQDMKSVLLGPSGVQGYMQQLDGTTANVKVLVNAQMTGNLGPQAMAQIDAEIKKILAQAGK